MDTEKPVEIQDHRTASRRRTNWFVIAALLSLLILCLLFLGEIAVQSPKSKDWTNH